MAPGETTQNHILVAWNKTADRICRDRLRMSPKANLPTNCPLYRQVLSRSLLPFREETSATKPPKHQQVCFYNEAFQPTDSAVILRLRPLSPSPLYDQDIEDYYLDLGQMGFERSLPSWKIVDTELNPRHLSSIWRSVSSHVFVCCLEEMSLRYGTDCCRNTIPCKGYF